MDWRAVWAKRGALGPYVKGMIGAALIIAIWQGYLWSAARYQEHTIMWQVVSQLIRDAQKQPAEPGVVK